MEVIYTKDGQAHVVEDINSAMDIVEEAVGLGIAAYIGNEICELFERAELLEGQVKEAELESSGWYELGNSVRGAIDELLTEFEDLPKKKAYERLTNILKMFDGGY